MLEKLMIIVSIIALIFAVFFGFQIIKISGDLDYYCKSNGYDGNRNKSCYKIENENFIKREFDCVNGKCYWVEEGS